LTIGGWELSATQSTFGNLSQHSAISINIQQSPINIQQSQNRQSPIRNLQSQSTFGNLNQHSAISKSAIANPQSAIDR
jgi:hypothetical protein